MAAAAFKVNGRQVFYCQDYSVKENNDASIERTFDGAIVNPGESDFTCDLKRILGPEKSREQIIETLVAESKKNPVPCVIVDAQPTYKKTIILTDCVFKGRDEGRSTGKTGSDSLSFIAAKRTVKFE